MKRRAIINIIHIHLPSQPVKLEITHHEQRTFAKGIAGKLVACFLPGCHRKMKQKGSTKQTIFFRKRNNKLKYKSMQDNCHVREEIKS